MINEPNDDLTRDEWYNWYMQFRDYAVLSAELDHVTELDNEERYNALMDRMETLENNPPRHL